MIILTKEDLQEVKEKAENGDQYDKDYYKYYSEFLSIVPLEKIVSNFDDEGFYEADAYQELLEELIQLTDEEASFSDISPSEDNHSLSFTFNGKTYTYTLVDKAEWFDIGFLKTINEALKDNNIPKAFYETVIFDGAEYVYLSDEEAERLINANRHIEK